ncbi:helix-hairpin-helix domain-containing protein [Natronoflexus pectinivorans]|uniref:DNA uptake protein ComE-like DNA-binding protein n=1 Tax=Natronoflexus pectinivorans TaxID=682526 RepID=A0A4R2GLD4_9BACT|nr:helix-hairpin-helix domain-containing protein [Natronoflexus pectinivorans]TCO09785.1 DNA uptake protein ComE-like DNA-binding protein [Natronoflexus pectinivorans]
MWKDYLSLTRNEQRGFIILVAIILILLVFRISMPLLYKPNTSLLVVSDSIPLKVISIIPHAFDEQIERAYFAFNPNEIDIDDLLRLGVDRRTANNWVRFLERGGRFNEPTDVGRVYGVEEDLLNSLLPYIEIPAPLMPQQQSLSENINSIRTLDLNRTAPELLEEIGWSQSMIDSFTNWQSSHWFPTRYELQRVESWTIDSLIILIHPTLIAKQERHTSVMDDLRISINLADTAHWQLLRGIGPVLSRRIVAYRRALGGFVDINQISEVYGISPVLFSDIKPYLVLDTIVVNPININTASVRQLREHPYLSFFHAKEIVDYRQKNGNIRNLNEIETLKELSDLSWERMRFYLCLGVDNE